MKYIISFLLILFSLNMASQSDTCFKKYEIINIANSIKELEAKFAAQSIIINEYKNQIANYERLSAQNNSIIAFKDDQIKILNDNINLYKDMYKVVKPKWYEKKILWFIGGAALTYGSVWAAGQLR